MKVIADLEVHSKYARAVSSQMNIPNIALWAHKKGVDLVGTGDFTHPIWFREIQANLEEAVDGIYKLKNDSTSNTRFLLTSEISCIYKDKGKGRRVHIMVYFPRLDDVGRFNKSLTALGANLFSDGRPNVGLTLSQIVQKALEASDRAIIIPAHVWTPWFGFYGANSGYDHLNDAFGDLEKYIPAIETGMSSDPAMNWRIEELLNKKIVSFGDAHSPTKLGREATVFELDTLSYEGIRKFPISYTIEFYPEEGKYHYTGHRNCKVVYSPNEVRKLGIICPVCGRPMTPGVMSRVEELGKVSIETKSGVDKFGVRWIKDVKEKRPGYVMLVPLMEILAETFGVGVGSKRVREEYERLIGIFGSEFKVLLETDINDIQKVAGPKTSEAISLVRSGDIIIEPGYDGVFGRVKIWPEKARKEDILDRQETLF